MKKQLQFAKHVSLAIWYGLVKNEKIPFEYHMDRADYIACEMRQEK